MKLTIDTDQQTLTCGDGETRKTIPLFSKAAFEAISHQWLRVGWNEKYPYTFSWLGRPVIQLPEDLIRIQEAVYRVKPSLIIETGVAHGGSLVYYASLCKAMGGGRVVGIDVDIRPHNRAAIEAHELFEFITLIEGSSVSVDVVGEVKRLIGSDDTVLVILDSDHSKAHVLAELNAYHAFVTPGSYIVATDGSMLFLHDVPRGEAEWQWNNPVSAVKEFLETHPDFVECPPPWPFNESALSENITHWPSAWLERVPR